MTKIRLNVCLVLVVFLAGCAGMADVASQISGRGVLKEKTSTFDNSHVIEVTPEFLYDPAGSWGNSIRLGARWTDAAPDLVALVLSYESSVSVGNAYAEFRGLDVNIDGYIQNFKVENPSSHSSSEYNTVTSTIYTESRNSVVVPYSLFKQMIGPGDVRLRIYTSDGYEDSRFSIERIPGGQGTAVLAFRKLAVRIQDFMASSP